MLCAGGKETRKKEEKEKSISGQQTKASTRKINQRTHIDSLASAGTRVEVGLANLIAGRPSS
jgi:hypothetical protein